MELRVKQELSNKCIWYRHLVCYGPGKQNCQTFASLKISNRLFYATTDLTIYRRGRRGVRIVVASLQEQKCLTRSVKIQEVEYDQ